MPNLSRQLAPLPRWGAHLRRLTVALSFATAALAARADIAVLREKGPHSGSAFSNPGLVADAPAGLKVTMKTADVKIHLRPGDGDTLKADVTADFEMEDSSPTELAGQLYLVGFPVTGLSSKIVTIDQFKVTVDGKEPAMVLLRSIAVSRRKSAIQETTISGRLDAHFGAEGQMVKVGAQYSDESHYRGSYVWQQVTSPGTKIRVKVAYVVTLRPQSVRYSKSYEAEESDSEVIPFKDLNMDRWEDKYYFFDYVLLSGATWDGPIGHEHVDLSSAPELGLGSYIHWSSRSPTGYHRLTEKMIEDRGGIQGMSSTEDGQRFILENCKPCGDLLFSIPLSAIHRKQQKKTSSHHLW